MSSRSDIASLCSTIVYILDDHPIAVPEPCKLISLTPPQLSPLITKPSASYHKYFVNIPKPYSYQAFHASRCHGINQKSGNIAKTPDVESIRANKISDQRQNIAIFVLVEHLRQLAQTIDRNRHLDLHTHFISLSRTPEIVAKGEHRSQNRQEQSIDLAPDSKPSAVAKPQKKPFASPEISISQSYKAYLYSKLVHLFV